MSTTRLIEMAAALIPVQRALAEQLRDVREGEEIPPELFEHVAAGLEWSAKFMENLIAELAPARKDQH